MQLPFVDTVVSCLKDMSLLGGILLQTSRLPAQQEQQNTVVPAGRDGSFRGTARRDTRGNPLRLLLCATILCLSFLYGAFQLLSTSSSIRQYHEEPPTEPYYAAASRPVRMIDRGAHHNDLLSSPPLEAAGVLGALALPAVKRSLAAVGWTEVDSVPITCMEGGGLWHQDEFWCIGGYMNDRVASFSPKTGQWTMRPSLLAVTHHTFGSAFSVMNGTRILVVGGLNNEGGNHGARLFNLQMLDTTTGGKNNGTWYEASEELGATELDLKGMVSCTRVLINQEYYCTFGSDTSFAIDSARFFAFNPFSLRFRALPVPPEPLSHVAMIADPLRHRVIYGMGRSIRDNPFSLENVCGEHLHFFDTKSATWNVVDQVQALPEFMPRLEARGFYQDPTNYHGFLFGGQYQIRNHVSDLVHKFTLSMDPNDRNITFEAWSRLPWQAHFGSGIEEAPPGSGILMLAGGSTAVGPNPTNKAWTWDQSYEPLMAIELQRRALGDTRPPPSFSVMSAVFGTNDVTRAVQVLLDEGWTEFVHGSMPDLGLLEEWQWHDGSWPQYIEKKSNGKVYRGGNAKQILSVTLQEPDGRVRVVVCPPGSGCKFSWWFDRDEIEYRYQLLNGTSNKSFQQHCTAPSKIF
jgi:hypothetical protein